MLNPALALEPAPDSPLREDAPWAMLDDPAEWQSFSRALPRDQGAWESYLAIEGMDCPGCSLSVEEALAGCPGVKSAQVNGGTATARVEWRPEAGKPSDWWRALRKAGYGALPAGDQLTSEPRRRAQRVMLWRWLVAGFCMMQVMMYAVPAYIAQPGDITPDALGLLRWASWLLTLPVLVFSCRPFFTSAWRDVRRFRLGMDVPVALGILIAFGASTAATFEPHGLLGGEVWFDSIAMFVFFLLSGRLLEQRLRDRTAGALEALARRLPETVERASTGSARTGEGSARTGEDSARTGEGPARTGEGSARTEGGSAGTGYAPLGGLFKRVPVRTLQPGDFIRVLPGEVIPADGLVVSGGSSVDEAVLTGESKPLSRSAGQGVIAGSHNLSGALVVQVLRCGAETRFAEIVSLMERASVEKPRVAQLADRIAGWFLLAVLAASAGAAAFWWPEGPSHAIGVAIAVLIVTCPCALSLATPAATLAAAGALARRGIVVRRLQALEDGASVDTVVFDKTGTLTKSRMAVASSRARAGTDGAEASKLAAALARHSLHPASLALAAAAAEGDAPDARAVREISGSGVQGEVRTAAGWRALRLGSAAFCGVDVSPSGQPRVHLSDDSGWVATFELDEAVREDAVSSVQSLKAQGLQAELLSGDAPDSTRRLADRAGIERCAGGQTPEAKLEHVRNLQAQGHRVAMVGDGMNDGPVLARADVSVAMGHAVPLAQAKADFIVSGECLSSVPILLAQARRCRSIVRQNLAWAAGYNLVCVPLAAIGAMPPWLAGIGMAASSLLVVLNSARLSRLPEGA